MPLSPGRCRSAWLSLWLYRQAAVHREAGVLALVSGGNASPALIGGIAEVAWDQLACAGGGRSIRSPPRGSGTASPPPHAASSSAISGARAAGRRNDARHTPAT